MNTLFDALIAGFLANSGGGGGSGGTDNYNALSNLPQINSTTLMGNKSSSDLGLQDTISDLSTIRSGAALGATAVQPETGKGLSTNDFTDAEKTKLAGIAEGAEVNEIDGIKVNSTTINPDANKVVNITVPTTAADVSALPASTKYAAALSLTINSSTFVMTGQLKDQDGNDLGTAQTIDLPLESVVVDGSYNSQTKKVVLTLQNGNTIEFSVADLISGLQTELSASNKLNPAYIDYDSTHRAVSDTEKSTWNSKQNALSSTQLSSVNSGITSADVAQITTNKNNISKDDAALVELVDNGAKNALQFDGISTPSGSADNITFTYNSNGSITVNGYTTDAGTAYVYLRLNGSNINADTWCNGNYVLSGCPTNDSGLSLQARGTDYTKSESGTGVELTPYSGSGAVRITVMVAKSSTIDNLTIRPMICSKAAWDISQTYQPYRPSYQELYERVLALENAT